MKLFRSKFVDLCLIAALLPVMASVASASPLIEKLDEISVSLKSGDGTGSGVLFTRKAGDDTVTFVWTAGHVVADLQSEDGNFGDATVIQGVIADGKRAGELRLEAEVLRFSPAVDGDDIALLRIRRKNVFKENVSVSFNLPNERVRAGAEIYHLGTFLGQLGFNSLTTGVVSQAERIIEFGATPLSFDQTTAVALPGSSGGGMFLKENGRYIGMLVRGMGPLNLIVPVDRLRAYAKRVDAEWAIDNTVPLPSEADIKKLTTAAPRVSRPVLMNRIELRDFLFRYRPENTFKPPALIPASR